MAKVINLQDVDKTAAKKSESKTTVGKTSASPRSTAKAAQAKANDAKANRSKGANAKPDAAKADKAPALVQMAAVTPMSGLAPVIPVTDAAAAEPKLVTSTVPVATGPELKKRDLVEKVAKRSGVKKKDAKLVVEAMLAVLGESIAEGRELILQPLGRLKTTRIKETANGRILICKLR